jgi:plastocyanin
VVLRASSIVVWIVGLGLSLGLPDARPRAQTRAEGTIYGRVEAGEAPPHPVRRPRVAELGGGIDHEPPEPSPSVVYLRSAPSSGSWRSEPRRATMDQRNETFVPHVLAVTVGTIVDFPNSDLVYHNVFSLSKAARFDLGRYAVGRSKTVRFDTPGVVRVFCDIHSHMNAFVLVFDHPFFAVTDGAGRFRIPGVPPGSYDVVAWREGDSSDPQPVTVPEGGATELNFTLR